MPASRIYNPFVNGIGGGGGTPDPNAEEIQTVSFSYSESSVLVLNIPANAKVLQTMIVIQTPFDDSSTTLMVGDSTLNNRLMQASQNDPTEANSYVAYNEYQYSLSTPVNIYINSGASTQGIGFVSIIYNINN